MEPGDVEKDPEGLEEFKEPFPDHEEEKVDTDTDEPKNDPNLDDN